MDSTGPNIQRVPNQLRGVVENSGVCETTKGVYQASGYADISEDGSIWFWFFAARNNPNTAPLALWFNGGPGSSSMIGLVQEHGPCRINNNTDTVSLNPYSWNEQANILYIDQPAGVGYSTGNRVIGTSVDAAHDIWTFIQIWLSDSKFSQYKNRDLAIWTDYGGHYGPAFAKYFLSQNAAIASGQVSGTTLNLKFLGIGNGLTGPLPQYQGIIDYAANNTYRTFDSKNLTSANDSWTRSDGCKARISSCYNNGTDATCSDAQDFCNQNVVGTLVQNINPYYTPNPPTDPYPRDPTIYLDSIASTIGADVNWTMSSDTIYENFALTGDWMRDSVPDLETVINTGVRTLLYDGDAVRHPDFIVNYKGVELMADSLITRFSDDYRGQSDFQTFTVSGQAAGLYKNAGTFSYLRIFGAGHEVPAYSFGSLAVGQAAFQMFNQIMANQSISSDGSSSGPNGNSIRPNSSQALGLRFSQLSIILLSLVMVLTLL
ncbi:alpha/beta-hydrolase [Macrolepiota fuliginosa MF-IS2]|uniref:Alpha/beta-hydrolase n=1 Tax=Macrolepiota fuliginosa MF-IS2 TaxID=1400762 RepID=A0A9P6C0R0_9AGAR|nr:alpha/beta-hydrolase [Macrolepiota fuliginosa MF-IS2]